jgi:Tol biopolymer transport system component
MRPFVAGLFLFLAVILASSVVRGATSHPTSPLPAAPDGGGMELQTERVSISTDGASRRGRISADGRWVAFSSVANNLTEDWQGSAEDIFLHDRETGTITDLSVGLAWTVDGDSLRPRLAADGGRVVWESVATNLVEWDENDVADIFLSDVQAGTRTRLTINAAGEEGNGASGYPDISGDGALIVFESLADNLVLSDTNGVMDIFVWETVR